MQIVKLCFLNKFLVRLRGEYNILVNTIYVSRIESSAIINLRAVSTKLNKYMCFLN